MSKKNTKIDITLPLYDVESQSRFIIDLASSADIDAKMLLGLILADWIATFYKSFDLSGGDSYKALVSFLSGCEKTKDFLNEIKDAYYAKTEK